MVEDRRVRAVVAVALLGLACAAAAPQEVPEPERGVVTIGNRELEVAVLHRRVQRERAFDDRDSRDYPEPFLMAYPRDRYQHVHNTGVNVPFQVVFITREGEVVGEDRLPADAERGVTSEHEAAYVLVVPLRSEREVETGRDARASFSDSIAALEPEDLAEVRVGRQVLHVEVVDSYETRARGLMYRTRVSEDEGMLFVYDREETRRFWMRNTEIPLSLAYIRGDGTIGHIIQRMEPRDATPRESRVPARYVLEVNEGWFAVHDVREGARIELP